MCSTLRLSARLDYACQDTSNLHERAWQQSETEILSELLYCSTSIMTLLKAETARVEIA
jgi:hypothetical protein